MKLGTDIEFPVFDNSGNLVPGYMITDADKHHPKKISQYLSVSWDNINLEVNTLPGKSPEDFRKNNERAVQQLKDLLEPHGLSVSDKSFLQVPEEFMLDPETLISGCDPDYCIYKHKGSLDISLDEYLKATCNKPVKLDQTPYRSAGGHIHIELPVKSITPKTIYTLIRGLDTKLLPYLDSMDSFSNQRRSLYGQKGSFRVNLKSKGNPYNGIEYRAPSNTWFLKADHEKVFNIVQDILATAA